MINLVPCLGYKEVLKMAIWDLRKYEDFAHPLLKNKDVKNSDFLLCLKSKTIAKFVRLGYIGVVLSAETERVNSVPTS